MTSQFTPIEEMPLSLPIPAIARHTADAFAQGQPTASKAESVRLNTLAVLVARDYCQLMDIPTDLAHSDSWNPLLRMTSDIADLVLPDLGQLECRPVRSNTTTCSMPPEVWDLRIGYVVVEIEEDLNTGHLLGFIPTVDSEEIALSSLQPLENLLDHLYTMRQAATAPSARTNAFTEAIAVSLNRWFDGAFQTGWQAVEDLLNPETLTPAFGFRGDRESPIPATDSEAASASAVRITRAKLLDFPVQPGQQPVVLVLILSEGLENAREITLQVHPAPGAPYLPTDLTLEVLEPDDTIFMQAHSRQADNYIQLQFSGHPGEAFKVLVRLAEAQYQENFTL